MLLSVFDEKFAPFLVPFFHKKGVLFWSLKGLLFSGTRVGSTGITEKHEVKVPGNLFMSQFNVLLSKYG